MRARTTSAPQIVAAASGAVLAATLAVGLPTGNADAGATSARGEAARKQPILRAFFGGRTVQYLNFGRINLRPGNKVSTIWRIGGGVPGQRDVIAGVTGSATYPAHVRAREVTWASGARPRPLRPAADVVRARARGEATVATTRTVLNAPVLGFRQTRHAGFARNRTIHYYELGRVSVAPGNEVLPI